MLDTSGAESGVVPKNATVSVVGIVDGSGHGDNIKVVSTIRGTVETLCSGAKTGVCTEIPHGSLGTGDSTAIRVSAYSCNWKVGHSTGKGHITE